MDMICDSFSAKLACRADPTPESIEALSSLVEVLEEMLPNPWLSPMEDASLSLAHRLRKAVSVSDQLSRLNELKISVYAGTYAASAQVPRYDVDEGLMCTRVGQKFEQVTACRILIDRAGLEHVVEQVADKWRAPLPSKPRKNPWLDDDDIPF